MSDVLDRYVNGSDVHGLESFFD